MDYASTTTQSVTSAVLGSNVLEGKHRGVSIINFDYLVKTQL